MGIRYLGVIIPLCVVGFLFLAPRIHTNAENAADFFKNIFEVNDVSGEIRIDGFRYEVDGQTVRGPYGATLSPQLEYQALRTMYALTLAKRRPLFGMAGVEPEKLDAAIDMLERAQMGFIELQKGPRDAIAVRSLYPISFLRSIAKLERARQAFLASASDVDAARYDAALAQATAEGERAIEDFKWAFDKVIDTETFRIGTTAGIMTEETMRSSIEAIRARMEETAEALKARAACLHGDLAPCERDVSVQDPPALLDGNGGTKGGVKQIALAHEVLAVFQDAIPPLDGEERTIALTSSACVGALEGPYVFSRLAPEHRASMPYRFVGDMLFFETRETRHPLQQYLRDTLDITYSRYNPFTFYTCPESGSDLSRLLVVDAIAEFALLHPDIAPQKRAALMRNEVYESDAYAYLQDALLQSRRDPRIRADEKDALETIALMTRQRGVGIDVLVSGMADVLLKDTEDYAQGIPFPFVSSAKVLFRAESAFPSLFLAYNESAGNSEIALHEENAREQKQYFDTIERYSELREEIPREVLLHDIREYARFEGAPI